MNLDNNHWRTHLFKFLSGAYFPLSSLWACPCLLGAGFPFLQLLSVLCSNSYILLLLFFILALPTVFFSFVSKDPQVPFTLLINKFLLTYLNFIAILSGLSHLFYSLYPSSRSINCLNENQNHPAPLYQFQCLFWRETDTVELTLYLICLLNGFFEVTFWMSFSWVYFFHQLDCKFVRDRLSILFTSASTSNPTPNSNLSLHTVSDQKRLWRFDLLMMPVTNMYEICLVCKSLL